MVKILRGDIDWANFDSSKGNEPRKKGPPEIRRALYKTLNQKTT